MIVVYSVYVWQDLLEYKKKHRVLRVRMLDGSVKTLMVDDSHTVAQLMITVCSKIGLYTCLSQLAVPVQSLNHRYKWTLITFIKC